MTCLLNYMPDEQSELQWLAARANLEHRQAQHFHDTVFSSTSGCLKAWRLADQLQDTLWALSMVYSRALTDEVSCMHEQCCACCAVPCCAVLCCAVLCCAVLRCAVLCCAVLCCASVLYCSLKACCSIKQSPQASTCSHILVPHS